MASHTTEILHDFSPMARVYKDGQIERLTGEDIVPPSVDPSTGVESKDVEISPETGVSVRLYRPRQTPSNPDHKLPLLIYFHGGGFIICSAFTAFYHKYINLLVAEANAVVVSVNYRRAPEFPLPVAYEDSWAAVKWVASHSTGGGQEPWLKDYVDFKRVFFAGDSAGGNITHNMGMRVGSKKLDGVKLVGAILVHPYFWGVEPVGSEPVHVDKRRFMEELWCYANPLISGADDPLMNPGLDPKLSSLGCKKVLVCVAEKDLLKDRCWYFYQVLGKSGWDGKVEIMEAKGEGHVFHLFDTSCENAKAKLKKVASFVNQKDDSK